MGVELHGEGIVGSEGMGVEMRKTLRNVGRRQSQPQILDRPVQRSGFAVELLNIDQLLGSEDERDGIGIVFFVAPPSTTASDHVCSPC